MDYIRYRFEKGYETEDITVLELTSPDPSSINIIKFDEHIDVHTTEIDDEGYHIYFDVGKDGISYDNDNKRFDIIWNGSIDRIDHKIDSEVTFLIFEDERVSRYKEENKVVFLDKDGNDIYTLIKNRKKEYSQDVYDKVKELMGEDFYNDYGPGSSAVWKIFHKVYINSLGRKGPYGAFRGEDLPKTYSMELSAKTFNELEDKVQRTKAGERISKYNFK